MGQVTDYARPPYNIITTTGQLAVSPKSFRGESLTCVLVLLLTKNAESNWTMMEAGMLQAGGARVF